MKDFSVAVARIVTVGLLLALAGSAAGQQAYPSKPIRLIVPFPPGGTNNSVARIVNQKLTESWGQPVIVDNRPGANSIIGTEALAKSPSDGYTILLTSGTHVLFPLLYRDLPFDAIKDFAPVATIDTSAFILVVNPSVPANNLRELIGLAKSKPGQLNVASPGTGGLQHLAGELLGIMAGVKMQHVPYKGGGQILIDLIGGQVQAYFASPIAGIPHIRSGRIKAIAIGGETRSPALPQVPTFTEAGLPGFDVTLWHGVLAPAGTPKAIIDKLAAELGRILAMSDTKEKLLSQGMEPFISTPEQLAALMKADTAKYSKVIKAANIRIEQ